MGRPGSGVVLNAYMKTNSKIPLTKKTGNRTLIIVVSIAVIATLSYFSLKPLRHSLAERYLDEGNRHLSEARYLDAMVDFRKSELLLPGSAANSIADASKMQENLASGEIYLRKYNNISLLNSIKEAQAVPDSESSGLLKVKELLQASQPQIAEIAAELLLEMDDRSAKAWMYKGIANLQAASSTQMTSEGRRANLATAKEAFLEATRLDSTDTLAKNYLAEIDKML